MVLYMYQIGFIFSIFKHIIIPKTCNSSLEGVSEASSFKEPTASLISPKIVSFFTDFDFGVIFGSYDFALAEKIELFSSSFTSFFHFVNDLVVILTVFLVFLFLTFVINSFSLNCFVSSISSTRSST